MEQLEASSTPTAGARRGRWWSSRRGQVALLAIAACLVELLPVEAVLLVFAGADGNPPDQAAVPFWYLCLVIAVAWMLSYRMRRSANRSILLASVIPFLVLYLLLLRISPSAYGYEGASFFDFSWLTGSSTTLPASDIPPSALILLLGVVIYVWLRGVSLGLKPETSTTISPRFALYLGVLVLAVLALNTIPPDIRAPDSAALTLLVIGEVFFGLVSAALTQLVAQRRAGNSAASGDDTRWVGSALLVALGVVVISLFASLIFGFESFLALLGSLGPVGIAIGSALTWLLNLLLNLLEQIAAAVSSLIHLTPPIKHKPTAQPPQIVLRCIHTVVNGKPEVHCAPTHSSPVPNWLLALIIGVVSAIVLTLVGLILFVVVRRVLTRYRQAEQPDIADEREALDGRALFAAQLRGLFDQFKRPSGETPDPLQRGSVRYMYRDVLRSAKSRGLDRPPGETPDEYAGRLAKTAPLATHATDTVDDLLALSDAYNNARYADREPDASVRAALQDRTRRLIKLLNG